MNSPDHKIATSTHPEPQQAADLSKLPPDMLVAIDGISYVTRRPIGELVARNLGGVLADSGRLYRALTKSILEAKVDPEDAAAVGDHCRNARLDIWVRRQAGDFDEALWFVNGDVFNEAELADVHADTAKVAFTHSARDRVKETLRKMGTWGRLVALGRDIGERVFPWTPYKVFVDAPEHLIPNNPSQNLVADFDFTYRNANRNNTFCPYGALRVAGGKDSNEQICQKILAEFVQKEAIQHQLEMFVFNPLPPWKKSL